METQIFNSLNARTRERNHRHISDDTLTQPDMSLSIKELIQKHSRGLLHNPTNPIYEPDIDINALNRLDLTERRELEKQNLELFQADENRKAQAKKDAEQKKRQLDIESEAQRLLQEKEKGTNGNQPPA